MRVILKLEVNIIKNYNTKQREALLNFFKNNIETQYSASDVAKEICEKNKIGKSTVFRLLKKLYEEGLLNSFVEKNSKVTYYQFSDKDKHCDSHFHLKCSKCKKIIHLECAESIELKKHIAENHSFTIDTVTSVLYGCCDSCKMKG